MVVGEWIKCKSERLEDGANSLKLRIRGRFRVAVVGYQQRRSSMATDSWSFYSSVDRLMHRFSDFHQRSLASTSSFYRKTVSKDFDAEEDTSLTRQIQAIAVPVLGNVCHIFMHGFNRVQIFGAKQLQDAVLHRPKTTPLLTVSNHVAAMDDPLVIASLLPPSVMLDANGVRWTLCASDRCFKNPVTSAFFKSLKVMPLSRGDGIYQKGMDLAISKLNRGEWVHIFPEGSRSRDGGKTMGSAKEGSEGMQDVMPLGAKFPRIGKTVTILVGDPIKFDDIISEGAKSSIPRKNLYDAVAARIGNHLRKLKLQVEELAALQDIQTQTYSPSASTQASTLLQNIDWEMLGIENYIANDDSSSRLNPLLDRQTSHPHQLDSNHDRLSEIPSISSLGDRVFWAADVVFGARGIFGSYMKHTNKEKMRHAEEGVSPLKTWNQLWKSMCEREEVGSTLAM